MSLASHIQQLAEGKLRVDTRVICAYEQKGAHSAEKEHKPAVVLPTQPFHPGGTFFSYWSNKIIEVNIIRW